MFRASFAILLAVIAVVVAFASCKKRHYNRYGDFTESETLTYESYVDSTFAPHEDFYRDTTDEESETIIVPFIRKDGVKYVEAEINGTFTVPMIVDTGCSTTLISLAEAEYLAQKGVLTIQDYEGESISVIADGSLSVNSVVILRQLAIKGVNGDLLYCGNVEALVSDNPQAPLLLGNEILDRLGGYMVDNTHDCMIFSL